MSSGIPKIPSRELLKWATPRQAEHIKVTIKEGSTRKAASALGVAASSVQSAIKSAEKKARIAGYDPEAGLDDPLGDPFFLKGTSINRGPDGEIRQRWDKYYVDEQRKLEIISSAIEELSKEAPRERPFSLKAITNDLLLNLYTMTDCHMGMLAWGKECGEDWDLKISEYVLTECFCAMVDASPPSKYCVINQLGDWLHTDGMEAVTPTGGHPLDADGRFSKIVSATIRVLRALVRKALTKHEIVYLVIAEGNHDIVSSIWLRQLFAAIYEDEPRVQVVDSEIPYYVHQHGEVMLAFHHGHKKKLTDLPLMFAAQYPEIWGATKFRYGHSGHMHNEKEIKAEFNGMKWRQHPTLAARDAYSARLGFISKREAESITYHKDFGQVGSITISPDMITPKTSGEQLGKSERPPLRLR